MNEQTVCQARCPNASSPRKQPEALIFQAPATREPVNRNEKAEIVNLLRDELPTAASIVVVSAVGITVNKVNGLRRQLETTGAKYRVVKNTLASLAIEGTESAPLSRLLKGTSALVYHPEEPSGPAKMLVEFARTNDKFELRGAILNGTLFDGAGVKTLSTMPGKNELRATLLSVFNGVGTKFVRTLAAAPTQMLNVLNARKDALS